jgi:hypothetical protein
MDAMEKKTGQPRKRRPDDKPKQDARQQAPDPANPKVPPASETWVEGQPTSDADYPK